MRDIGLTTREEEHNDFALKLNGVHLLVGRLLAAIFRKALTEVLILLSNPAAVSCTKTII